MSMQQAKTDVHLAKCSYPSLPVLSWLREQQHPGTLELVHGTHSYASQVMSIRKLKPTASPCTSFLPGGEKKKATFWKFYRMQSDKFSFWVGGFVASADFIPFRMPGFPAREMRKETALACPCASSADSSLLFPPAHKHMQSAAARGTADCSDAAWLGRTLCLISVGEKNLH